MKYEWKEINSENIAKFWFVYKFERYFETSSRMIESTVAELAAANTAVEVSWL